ncbi:MAG: ABC transporter ATP-binding protein [Aureliella sp.]
MSQIAIRVDGLSKRYSIGSKPRGYKTLREVVTDAVAKPIRALRNGFSSDNADSTDIWAVKNVSFEVKRGDVIGVIGSNGAGKSTLLKILSRITHPTSGFADIYGRVGALLEVGTGFHPELTGRENCLLNGAILGMSRREILSKFDQIVDFAGVEQFIDTPVKYYSSGMYLRLAFAVAAHLEPEILVVDEVLAVGDTAFQKKCLGRMEAVAKEGRTVLFVSHNMGAVRSLCTKALFLHDGMADGIEDVGECIERYFKAVGAIPGAKDLEMDDPTRGFSRVVIDQGDGNTVDQANEFEVSTTLHIDREYQAFTLFGILEDMHGKMVFHLKKDSSEFGIRNCRPGRYEIRLKLPVLWLNPGLYAFHFKAIFSGGGGMTRQVSDKFPLDVSGENSGAADAVLHPSASWSVV